MALCEKYAIIGDKQMNVYSIDTIIQNQDILVGDNQTAVEIEHNGSSVILPVREKKDDDISKPGFYVDDDPLVFISYPVTEDEEKIYMPSSDKVFDMRDIKTMQELVTKKEEYDQTVTSLLETDLDDDSIFKPPLLKTDTPEMRALKEAIIAKQIDLDKYSSRFGDNYPNDKRKLKDDNITSYMLKRICDNLDIQVDLVFRDTKSNVPNPMGKVVKVNMVPGYDNAILIEDAEEVAEAEEREGMDDI